MQNSIKHSSQLLIWITPSPGPHWATSPSAPGAQLFNGKTVQSTHIQPGFERLGALRTHFLSLSSCRIQTAALLRLSNIPSVPSPRKPARTGFASPLVSTGTLRRTSGRQSPCRQAAIQCTNLNSVHSILTDGSNDAVARLIPLISW